MVACLVIIFGNFTIMSWVTMKYVERPPRNIFPFHASPSPGQWATTTDEQNQYADLRFFVFYGRLQRSYHKAYSPIPSTYKYPTGFENQPCWLKVNSIPKQQKVSVSTEEWELYSFEMILGRGWYFSLPFLMCELKNMICLSELLEGEGHASHCCRTWSPAEPI